MGMGTKLLKSSRDFNCFEGNMGKSSVLLRGHFLDFFKGLDRLSMAS
jgi:hypothetical protein